MAAASAGTLQSGIVPSSTSSGAESQMSSILQPHQHPQQQSTVVLQHQKQQQQQQQHLHQQQQHQSLQFHPSQSGPQPQQQRNSFLPRVGNESHLSGSAIGGRHVVAATAAAAVAVAAGGTSTGGETLSGSGLAAGIAAGPQTLQQASALVQRQLHMTNAANLAPGWRRVVSNNEVVYISDDQQVNRDLLEDRDTFFGRSQPTGYAFNMQAPSGASLRTHGQIKDYLLSPGTCKCGLPCPLRPEYFFDFNSQVPNTPLQIPLDNGLSSRSTLLCMHQRRFIETQQNLLQKEVKRRKFNDMSSSGKIITSPVPQCNSVAVYSGNVMQTSQVMGNNGRTQMMAPQLVNSSQQQGISNVSFHAAQVQKSQHSDQDGMQHNKAESEKQIGSVTLSKTPPWRKNSLLQSNQNQTTNVPHTGQLYSASNERVPPLPQAHLCQSSGNNPSQGQTQTPPWQQDQVPSRFIKTRSPVTNKKKPNFKDDPTGYMDHQTAILHNSMMNVVQSPDLNDTGYESVESDLSTRTGVAKSTQQQIKSEQGMPVMQQNQNVYHPTTAVEIKAEHVKVEPPSAGRSYPGGIQTYQSQHPTAEQHVPPSSFIYSQQARIVGSNQALDMHPKQHQQMQPVPQQVIANVPSSQQVMIEKGSPMVRGQFQCDEQNFGRTRGMSQPTTTTIGGQTVTHFPNGMVQVEQNCDNMAPLKPQQQIQLQQQIQQQNILFRQNQQLQKSLGKGAPEYQYIQNVCEQKVQSTGQVLVATSQESPISSSTTANRCTPERRNNPDCKGPPQVGAISTSNQSPHPCPLPAESPESSTNTKVASPRPINLAQLKPHHGIFATSQTSGRNTITSVTAGKAITATTSVNDKISMNLIEPNNEIHHQHHSQQPQQQQQQQQQQQHHQQPQKLTTSNVISASGIQIQPVVREPSNQLIMTSTGQLIVVPAQSSKTSNQVIINNPGGSNLVMNNQPNVLINQQSSVVNNSQLIGNSVDVLSNQSNASNIIQNSGNGLVIQNSNIVQGGQNIIQSPNNLITSNSSNFIVNSAGNMQPLILNNSNLIQQNGQNLIATNATNIIQQNSAGSASIMAAGNAQKVLNNQNIITNQSGVINNQVLGNSNNVLSASGGGLIGQQTVVLNTLPNGYVIQPNFTTATVDGQVVGQIVNQENGSAYLQTHQQRQIILTSPDSKRKAKKRKSSASSSPSTPSSLSPQQSPTANVAQTGNPQGTMVQITPQYSSQGFQISPGIQGIVVNKNTQSTQPQQQILFQNGQIIQPVNLIGQQLLVPAGLVVTPETTLVQIQNVGPCGGLIAPQGMVLRAPSPQNKNFLSPNAGGQQFIVGGGSQVSPLGQIYSTPVGLVVPQSNSGTATFVQQNTAIVQQPAIITNSNSPDASTDSSLQSQNTASPPDTTTHSPRSPERPPSEKSGGSDMVQCVSSSEPDSVVSPAIADSAQSPTTTDCERSGSVSYQVNVYKPSDAKIRKIETPTQFSNSTTPETITQIKPDSHESPTNSPTASATSTTSSGGSNLSGGGSGGCGAQQPSFSIGELVWGAARGHPAWPGKILSPPEGICTPSDSTWVQWFGPGGRPNVELVAINSLKSLSEGLEAHHKAQKDTRKSRKLNSQLERAIQEAMAELDRMSSTAQPPTTPVSSKNRNRGRQQQTAGGHQRSKPVKIAPAPPCTGSNIQQIRQQTTITQVTHHQHQAVGQPQQQQPAAPTK